MAYGRSSIAPYYLNTIAKARAEEELLEKRIKAQKEEAAKDRWLRVGTSVADIGARFGMQAYSDYLKSEQKKADLVGPMGSVAAQGDAALKAKQAAAKPPPSMRQPAVKKPTPEEKVPTRPAPGETITLEKGVESAKRASEFLSREERKAMNKKEKDRAGPRKHLISRLGKDAPYETTRDIQIHEGEGTFRSPAPASAKKMAEENPEAAAPPTKADDPVASWSKKYYAYLNRGGEHPGQPPKVTDRTLENRGLLQADGSRVSMAELRKKHPNDREFRDAVYASKLMEKNQLDVQFKRAQIEKLAYDKQMRPARFLDESVSLQNKVLSGKISLENARQNYQKLLFAVQEYNRGVPTGKGKNRRYLPPKVLIRIEGEHHLFKGLPNIYIPADYTGKLTGAGSGGARGKPGRKKVVVKGSKVKGQYPISMTYGKVDSVGNKKQYLSMRLRDMKQVNTLMSKIELGTKTKGGAYTDPVPVTDAGHSKLKKLYNEISILPEGTEEWRLVAKKIASTVNVSNYQKLSGTKGHPTKDWYRQKKVIEKKTKAYADARAKLYNLQASYSTAKTTFMGTKNKNTVMFGEWDGERVGGGTFNKHIGRDDVRKRMDNPSYMPSATHETLKAKVSEALNYRARLAKTNWSDGVKSFRGRWLSSVKAAGWKIVFGKRATLKETMKFMRGELDAPEQPAASYDKGGPVLSDGFLTDEKGEPYAKVHEGEQVVPQGGASVSNMGINPEQLLWLKWEEQDMSKERKQAGFSRDIRMLKEARDAAVVRGGA